MKSKFSSIEELVKEIDNAIATLQGKKKELLKAADHKFDAVEDKAIEYGADQGLKGFKNFTASIYRDNYDLLAKAAFKADMTISSFLKKTSLLDLHNDKDLYFKYQKKIEEFLRNRNERGRNIDRKTIGLSINSDDLKDFEELVETYKMKSPKELVRFLVDMFLYKELAKENISNDFGFSKLPYNRCKSSHIQGYSYDEKAKHLFVKFIDGPVYMYNNVSKDTYKGLCEAESKGKYFNQTILADPKKYDFIKFYVGE